MGMMQNAPRFQGEAITPAVAPPAAAAALRPRHRALWWSFLAVVVLPIALAAAYLALFAAPQYRTSFAFSVERDSPATAMEMLGGFTALPGAGGGAADSDMLFEYIRSRDLVTEVDRELDLADLFGRPAEDDPVFAYRGGTGEDLARYWRRMVRVSHDAGAGLIEVRVAAFAPRDAAAVAAAILEAATRRINELSDTARADATREARADLAARRAELAAAREAMTAFRARTQMVDPMADLQGRMGLLGELQTRLAEEMIRVDLLSARTEGGDPRLVEGRETIDAIETRIAAERLRLGSGAGAAVAGDAPAEAYAELVDAYAGLAVEVEIAEQAYAMARAALDTAEAEARRRTRYVTPFVRPIPAERATAPDPALILGIGGGLLLLAWGVGALTVYAVRDRA